MLLLHVLTKIPAEIDNFVDSFRDLFGFESALLYLHYFAILRIFWIFCWFLLRFVLRLIVWGTLLDGWRRFEGLFNGFRGKFEIKTGIILFSTKQKLRWVEEYPREFKLNSNWNFSDFLNFFREFINKLGIWGQIRRIFMEVISIFGVHLLVKLPISSPHLEFKKKFKFCPLKFHRNE